MKKKVFIEGMSCQNCVRHVRTALERLEGVEVIEINLEGKYAIVNADIRESIYVTGIEEMGYDVISVEEIA